MDKMARIDQGEINTGCQTQVYNETCTDNIIIHNANFQGTNLNV